ncbi:4'-phosphopantetheinyl transferase family protein [Roseivirga seohaensis]|uniref:4'-phosphopantetheinyl transferase family protein n=1 Tax=Roseivirga seohaensis TaxID=1914963 RepID=UPI00069F51D9|nr:4'-phosphopantetheinyl transferase superfamily protein [Roseivirga seohaensis]
MPLFLKANITEEVCFAIWKIEESEEELMHIYQPSAAEIRVLSGFKIEIKRREWLSSRLALKTLFPYQDYEVNKDAFGKPHISLAGVEISISHAKSFGAAAYSLNGPIGIDIEHDRDQITRIAHKFLHPTEKPWAENRVDKLTQIWCAKEALYKLHGRTQLIFADQLVVGQPNLQQQASGQIIESGISSVFNVQWLKEADLNCCLAY